MKPARLMMSSLMALLVLGFIVQDARAGEVRRRERRQQARIEQGEKSGELTQGEANRLEKGEGRIEGAREAAAADGKITPAERRKLNRMENRESRRIWRDKHNNRKAADNGGAATPGAPAAPAQPAQPSGQ